MSLEFLPVLYIKASSNYDVGNIIGRTFKGSIKEYLNFSDDVKMYRKFFNDQRGKAIVEQYLKTSEKYQPDIVSEIRGIADGSGESFMDVFMLQIASEIQFYHYEDLFPNNDAPKNQVTKGCTDILLNTAAGRAIGHNDDWSEDVAARVAIVHVTLTKDGFEKESFLSYLYPGYLPGFCFGMNKNLVVTLNSLKPARANPGGVPLLLRTLLGNSSISDCRERMASLPVGCAFGMNVNIAEIGTDKMCSLEIYTHLNLLHVYRVNPHRHQPCVSLPFLN
ncbi:uncharacterized protein LOC128231088 [Mya arenaria]|uniref:uncharacterized protein LOC128231088 n=1 Tax=Mya arenaria TaxID=6604 RepID=UPI0022DFB216|nr:uncharacterized protein LOC128231088 [Mya arenaria]